MQVILSVFVCRQKIIFVFVFAFVIFWREGRGPKKKYFEKMEKMEKMENGKWEMENGKRRGEPKCGF